jgi:hypothetical protein
MITLMIINFLIILSIPVHIIIYISHQYQENKEIV